MFSFVGLVLFSAILVGWIAAAVVYTVRYYGKGYGPRSFIEPKDFPGLYPGA